MFNVGGGELLVILLIALVVLGPERLPDAARKIGRFMAEVRKMTAGFQEEVRSAMDLDGSSSGSDDAVHRTESGPRLLGPPEPPAAPGADADPSAPPSASPSDEPPDQAGRGDTSAA